MARPLCYFVYHPMVGTGCLDENAVVEFVEARISAARRGAVERHLDTCDLCRVLVAQTARALHPGNDNQAPQDSDGSSPLTAGELGAGDLVGRYRLLHQVGTGAMGVVYAARHLGLKREVALKVVRADPHRGSDDSQLRARLLREARAASAVRHDNVVTVHDVLTLDDGSPVLVMDLLSGETLRERLDRVSSLAVGEAIRLGVDVLDALDTAHRSGVVHRDLKPDNIFLAQGDGDGAYTVKIVDFGIAKLTAIDGPAAETAGLTETNMLVGTPHYMAPEQAFADEGVDHRIDLWAVGVILYECLSGERPIDGANVGQILKRLAHLSITPLGRAAPHLPPALAELVDELLSERERRPSSAAEVRQRLVRIAAHPAIDDGVGEPPGTARRDASAVSDGASLGEAATEQWPPPPRPTAGRRAVVGLSLAVLVIAGLGWYGAADRHRQEADSDAHAASASATPPDSPPAEPLVSEPPKTPGARSSLGSSRATPASSSPSNAPPVAPRPSVPPLAQHPRPNTKATAPPGASDTPPDTTGPGKLLTDPPF